MDHSPLKSHPPTEAPALSGRLIADYKKTRDLSSALAAPLSPEDQTVQSMDDASPTKWHLAHTTWFFETFILGELMAGYEPFDEAYRYLFNSYYNGIGRQFSRPDRGKITRPGAAEVLDYRAHVDRAMTQLMESASGNAAARLAELVELGVNHEQQHQELIVTDIKHALAVNPLHPSYHKAEGANGANGKALAAKPGWISFDGGIAEIGHAGEGFAYDNESPRHRVFLEPYALASRPATNGDYLEFMADGGYERANLWLSAGWAFLRENDWSSPYYWLECDGEWFEYTLSGLKPLDPAQPVTHVNFYEANAFANWSAKRLPTEAEWEHGANGHATGGNFLDVERLHPRKAGDGDGLMQMFGDVWEWTVSSYGPYPGYRAPDGAIGEYNGKFMCDQYVLRGGSCATPEGHVRKTYRNFFPAYASWQFTGIRLAESL